MYLQGLDYAHRQAVSTFNDQSRGFEGPMKRKMIVVILPLMLIAMWHSTPAQPDACNPEPELPYASELLDVLHQGIEANNATGVSAAVIVPGYTPWAGVAGVSNRATGEALQPGMLFLVASIGKNYLAALVLKLAEQGQISLDDPLGKWITEYPNLDRNITVRQLLNQTSGLPDFAKHPNSPYQTPYSSIDFAKSWTSEEILTKMLGEPVARPGEGWHYSTTNFVLLKIIVEQTTRSTFPAELRKRVLDPLGLKATVPLAGSATVPAGFDIARNWYDADDDGILDDISTNPITWHSIVPHVVFTTAGDLARWSDALFKERKVLSEQYLGEMLTFHSPVSDPKDPLIVGYGLGTAEFPSDLFGGDRAIGHLGWEFGWMGAMLFFPEHSVSVVVLMNDNNEPCITQLATGLWSAIKGHLAASD
jgi:D-alanyl-D-alanine carboxypeptidase